MRKTLFVFTTILFFALSLSSCKKDEVNNNANNNSNTENPGGGGSEGGWHVYPSTAYVLPNAVTDIDGNSYDAVQIGNQVWMAENLRTTKYADGTSIPLDSSLSNTEPYRYAPGPNESNEENMANVPHYGYLYNWPAVMHGANSSESNPSGVQGICPNGWHVPSDAEWRELTDYMKTQPAYTASGNPEHLAKALAATWGWESSNSTDAPGNNPSTNNATGFSALPAGGHYGYNISGQFSISAGFWGTSSDGSHLHFKCIRCDDAVMQWYIVGSTAGLSVRCVRD